MFRLLTLQMKHDESPSLMPLEYKEGHMKLSDA